MECATTVMKTNTNKTQQTKQTKQTQQTQQTSIKKFLGYGAAARAWCGNSKYN